MTPKKKVFRPTYRVHDEKTIQADIQARCPMGSPFFDYLTEIRLDDLSFGQSEFDRGVAEGMRRLARQIQDFVMAEQIEGK